MTECNVEVEVYTAWDEKTIEIRVKHRYETALRENKDIEFHYGHTCLSNGKERFSLLSITKRRVK